MTNMKSSRKPPSCISPLKQLYAVFHILPHDRLTDTGKGDFVGERKSTLEIATRYSGEGADAVYKTKAIVRSIVVSVMTSADSATSEQHLASNYLSYRSCKRDGKCGWRGKLLHTSKYS